MYPSTPAAKSNAKQFLKGNYISATIVSLVLLAAISLIAMLRSLIAVLFSIGDTNFTLSIDILHPIKLLGFFSLAAVTFLLVCTLVGPIYLGVYRWFWNLTADNTLSAGQVFYYFSQGLYRKTVTFIVCFLWKIVRCVIFAFLPYAVTVTLSSPQLYKLFGSTVPIFMASLAPLTMLFSVAGFALTVFYIFRIYLIVPLYCNDDTATNKEVFLLAKQLSYYTASGYFSFLASFIGWFLLSLFAIPMLYTIPYFACANAMYCRFALNYSNNTNHFVEN